MKNSRAARLIKGVARLTAREKLPARAAGLSYFLTMTFFPMLICLYTMLGSFFPAMGELEDFLSVMMPEETVKAVMDFLRYVSENLSNTMLVAALVVLVTSASAAYRVIHNATVDMRGGPKENWLLVLIFSLVFSVLFLIAIYLSVLMIVTGRWFLDFVDRHFRYWNISAGWSWARFLLLLLLLFVLQGAICRFTAPRGVPVRILPGAALSAVLQVGVSILFSWFIGVFSRYPLVYGSLASVIIMMLWLYFWGLLLLLGNALNIALEQMDAQSSSISTTETS